MQLLAQRGQFPERGRCGQPYGDAKFVAPRRAANASGRAGGPASEARAIHADERAIGRMPLGVVDRLWPVAVEDVDVVATGAQLAVDVVNQDVPAEQAGSV